MAIEINASAIFESSAWRPSVSVRAPHGAGTVTAIAYVFSASFKTQDDALAAARRLATMAAMSPDRLLESASAAFAMQ